ncbi:hypothetical protein PoB_003094300 [Plakobranchus ocellatus]|uniref:Uncharacterized protein n=1 Tax=Plakobranchus ocellatus TaxID=259542 RepID=A0AAV4AD21_9GAST|nr:hypothetical protein PoB_003094300 [Plakobranchus ocellatus]
MSDRPFLTGACCGLVWFLGLASPQPDDLRLSDSPSGQGADGDAQTRGRRTCADLRATMLSTVSPQLHKISCENSEVALWVFGLSLMSLNLIDTKKECLYLTGGTRFYVRRTMHCRNSGDNHRQAACRTGDYVHTVVLSLK